MSGHRGHFGFAKCLTCGKEFERRSKDQHYCCIQCWYDYRNKKMAQENNEKVVTRLSVYLCHKWKAEGWSEQEIADILGCKLEKVMFCLSVPITKDEIAAMREFYAPRTRMVRRWKATSRPLPKW